jgi:ribonucleoside-triphosphate reductase
MLLAAAGDKAYAQAPFTEVRTPDEILKEYGGQSLFASGLIVDGLHAFDNDLWKACATAMGFGETLSEDGAQDLLKRDWVRRFNKFAEHYDGNLEKTSFLLKDCYNYHKWVSITSTIKEINFSQALAEKDYVDVSTLGSQACAGGVCELTF